MQQAQRRALLSVRVGKHVSKASSRRLSSYAAAAPWDPAGYKDFAAERLRPVRDLLNQVPKISATQPHVVDVGCGAGGSSMLLLEKFPSAKMLCMDSSPEMLAAAEAEDALNSRALLKFKLETIEEHFSTAAAASGGLYDLIFANESLHWCDDLPNLMARMIARVRPGGVLGMQIPDTRTQVSHVLMRETAAEFGLASDAIRVPTNRCEPQEYGQALLGPLCQHLDMWTTT